MQPFTLTLSDSLTITGLSSIPTSFQKAGSLPLLVLLHGGSYAADYYDADNEKSISTLSEALGVPVLSLNRQGYKGSTPIAPLTSGQTSMKEQAKTLNEVILPALWDEYGKNSGVSSIVLAGHSVGGFIAVMVAGLYPTSSKAYPLSGLCLTGVADKVNSAFDNADPPQVPLDPTGKFALWPDAVRDGWLLMIPAGKADPNFSARHAELNNPAPIEEVSESMSKNPEWRGFVKDVEVPVLALVGQYDGLWDTSASTVSRFGELFEKTYAETGVIGNAPHCAELSFQGRAVFLKILGHAVQCAVEYEHGTK